MILTIALGMVLGFLFIGLLIVFAEQIAHLFLLIVGAVVVGAAIFAVFWLIQGALSMTADDWFVLLALVIIGGISVAIVLPMYLFDRWLERRKNREMESQT